MKSLTGSIILDFPPLKLMHFSNYNISPFFIATAASLRDRIEMLPSLGPRWQAIDILPGFGRPKQPATLFFRDPVEAIQSLLVHPELTEHLEYAPRREWTSGNRDDESRIYSEMFTGRWIWDQQAALANSGHKDATILAWMLASDKTHLTWFSGDKKAWPLYLSLGNIKSKARNSLLKHAWIPIGYLPVVDWRDPKDIRGALSQRLFHQCIKIIIGSTHKPNNAGQMFVDAEGKERLCFLRFAAWIGDLPEQQLINCASASNCPTSTAGFQALDDPEPHPPRTREWILERIRRVRARIDPAHVKAYQTYARKLGLNAVHEPFWIKIPEFDPSISIPPDNLHGPSRFWRDHLLHWLVGLIDPSELDARISALQGTIGVRHFPNGITSLSQWTGRQEREVQRVLVASVAGANGVTPQVMQNIRAFHDFLYLARYRSHSSATIHYLESALQDFHKTKGVYIRTGVRRATRDVMDHFRIPKLACFHAYARHIPQMGSSSQYSSEFAENNHQPLAKRPYKATNRRNFGPQMCRYLDRMERLRTFSHLIHWSMAHNERVKMTNALLPLSPGFRASAQHLLEAMRSRDTPGTTMDPNSLGAMPRTRLSGLRAKTRLWFNIQPTHTRMDIDVIATQYQLPDLPEQIRRLLRDRQGQSTRVETVLFANVWENMRIRNPDVQDDEVFSQTHTVQALPPSPQYPCGHCHCVLVHNGEEAEPTGVQGYRVAQVRLFFQLHLQSFDRQLVKLPLAYVQFFTQFEDRTERNINMYKVSRLSESGQSRPGTLIPIKSIARFVQLVPDFGRHVHPLLTAETSAEIAIH
ncbi:related to Zn-finger domain-containing protein-Laccaria bicolor [Serendipita indica DSM 11827]|uniref:Related to Zn-finger domain-containing protein-Laccaria bicolor n=1 Tax=Serendipita indica (strain DSM 11827) TaxID=1109443 RepID=G4TUF1_SERID|nr:related to Zn-finger domain-containing protein-Laccaria bicolor [Serendipita indica DSM 11827]